MKLLLILAIVVASAYAQTNGEEKTYNVQGCGKRPKARGELPGRVVGGQESKVGDWGWQILLKKNSNFICGGSLINWKAAITAAHCTDGGSTATWSVDIGLHNRTTPESWVISRTVNKYYQHNSYGGLINKNDISILTWTTGVTYRDEIVPVCLADATFNYDNLKGWATGWGTTASGGSTSSTLREVDLLLRSDADCKKSYPNVDSSMMVCGGEVGDNKDTCQGDSGGPLVYNNNGTWQLVGITSWGRGCGDVGVYARVSYFLGWVQDRLNEAF